MNLTLQQKEALLKKNEGLLYLTVWRFKRRLNGSFNNFHDLHQEAIAAYMEYLNHCKKEEDLKIFPGKFIFNCMSRYIMNTQPVKFTKRTTDFNRHISSIRGTTPYETLDATKGNGRPGDDDEMLLRILLKDFRDTLDDFERNVFRLRYSGLKDYVIAQELHVSPPTVARAVKRLREKYHDYAA